MKNIKIIPGSLGGEIRVPPSKSLCHRAIIAAALAQGQSIISNVILSEDIMATIKGVQSLGAKVTFQQDKLIINGTTPKVENNCVIDCSESGSTLRFLIPLGLMQNNTITYTGNGNLGSRPLDPYIKIFKEHGITYNNSKLPISVTGKLTSGVFNIPGNISSQFITGLMFALPLLEGDSTIAITDSLESKGYIDLTIDTLKSFGIIIENHDYHSFYIRGNQNYKLTQYYVEGDYSQAAFWLAAGALNGNIACLGLDVKSKQGDNVIIDFLKLAAANLELNSYYIKSSTSELRSFQVDVSQCPDLAPILAVLAALSDGTSRIVGASRLRIKECDRLKAIATELNKLGAKVCEESDSLTIEGMKFLKGGEVNSWGDHRIAMSLAIAATRCTEPVIIHNSNVVHKSYPDFFNDYVMLGGNLYEWNLG